jgi:hypothetical protein
MTTKYMLQKLLKRLKSQTLNCHFKRTFLTLVQDVEGRKEVIQTRKHERSTFVPKENGGGHGQFNSGVGEVTLAIFISRPTS